jgi:NTE family protein
MEALHSDPARTEFARSIPILAGLTAELQAEIASRAVWIQVPAGEWLFRQGDPGDSLFAVRTGRLEIVVEEPEQQVVRVLTRGAVVGELALIAGSSRSASVRARRDSELLRLGREQFSDLLREEPEFALALTRELGHQLQLSRGLALPAEAAPTTISVVPLEPGISADDFGHQLASELSRFGKVACLNGDEGGLDPGSYAEALDRCEREHDQVLLLARSPAEPGTWEQFCLRQADRIIALSSGGAIPAWLGAHPHLQGCDLVFLGRDERRPPPMGPWLDALRPRVQIPIRRGASAGSVAGVARRLAARSTGIVLSGGGARGFAHIGVLEELSRSGIAIDRVGGCSMGAFVGAMFAMDMPTGAIAARCREELVKRNPMSDYTLPVVSLIRGQRGEAMLKRTFRDTLVEELPREYFSVSCDLVSGNLVTHRRGLLYEAVGPSMSLPGIFPPVALDGRLLVDGGVLNNLPVEPMAASAEGPVIAVDVTAEFLPGGPGANSRTRTVRDRWFDRARKRAGGSDSPLPSLKETLTRSIAIGSVDAVQLARRKASLLIAPQTGGVGLVEWSAIDRMIAAGRQATRETLEAMPELVSTLAA